MHGRWCWDLAERSSSLWGSPRPAQLHHGQYVSGAYVQIMLRSIFCSVPPQKFLCVSRIHTIYLALMCGKKRKTFRFQDFWAKSKIRTFKKGNADFPLTALPVTKLPTPASLSVIKSILDSLKTCFDYILLLKRSFNFTESLLSLNSCLEYGIFLYNPNLNKFRLISSQPKAVYQCLMEEEV